MVIAVIFWGVLFVIEAIVPAGTGTLFGNCGGACGGAVPPAGSVRLKAHPPPPVPPPSLPEPTAPSPPPQEMKLGTPVAGSTGAAPGEVAVVDVVP